MSLSDQQRSELIDRAVRARKGAYAPYSKYLVGAALITEDGTIFHGVNVENASYPMTMCAERNAVFTAVAEGFQSFEAIVVATENGGSPCGACRQVLSEFGLDTQVLSVDEGSNMVLDTTVRELIPYAFGPTDLE